MNKLGLKRWFYSPQEHAWQLQIQLLQQILVLFVSIALIIVTPSLFTSLSSCTKKYSVIINNGMMKMLKIIISTVIIIQFPFITNARLASAPLEFSSPILPRCRQTKRTSSQGFKVQITLKNDPCFQIASFPLVPFNSQSVELKNCNRENKTSLLENAVALAKFRYWICYKMFHSLHLSDTSKVDPI